MWCCFHQTTTRLPCPAWLGELKFLLTHPEAELKYSIHLFGYQYCPGDAICPPAVLDYVVASRADDVLCSPDTVVDSLRWNVSYLALLCQSGVQVSVSMYYSRSRSSQVFKWLILQFSALHFCFSKTGEKMQKKERKKRNNGFTLGG
jgi:hypothetical protein